MSEEAFEEWAKAQPGGYGRQWDWERASWMAAWQQATEASAKIVEDSCVLHGIGQRSHCDCGTVPDQDELAAAIRQLKGEG